MKKTYILLLTIMIVTLAAGCSKDSAEKVRYDMEKLAYMAGKLAERINIQPNLTTASDSTALKNAYQGIVDYFQEYRNHPLIAENDTIVNQMSRMAISAQLQLARYYTGKRLADSVIAAYSRIGNDIPAGRADIIGARFALALTFRSMTVFDSTIAIYDRLLAEFYPPLDELGGVHHDLMAIPIDKIKIVNGINDQARVKSFTKEAIDYYQKVKNDFPQDSALVRRAKVNTSRIYTMTEQWDKAIDQLEQLLDSTGQIEIAASVLIANIYNGPKKDLKRSIKLYKEILERKPDSTIIGSTLLQLGMVLCSENQHDEGRKTLAELKKNFPNVPRLVSKAQFYYAQSFEVQGRWDRALSEYQWLMENHPYAEESFWAARRIPEHFEKEKNDKLAATWYDRAADFYQRAANIKQGQPIEMAAYTYLAEIYRITRQWDKAMETLDKIYAMAPRTNIGAKALYNAASVAYKEMGDSLLAQNYLNRLNREFGTTDSTRIYEEEKTELNLESLE